MYLTQKSWFKLPALDCLLLRGAHIKTSGKSEDACMSQVGVTIHELASLSWPRVSAQACRGRLGETCRRDLAAGGRGAFSQPSPCCVRRFTSVRLMGIDTDLHAIQCSDWC
jgi:hypothetical protein